jgi:hypothetical protein
MPGHSKLRLRFCLDRPSRQTGGAGLGWAIAHKLIRFNQGTLAANIKVSWGKTFTIALHFCLPENSNRKIPQSPFCSGKRQKLEKLTSEIIAKKRF